MRRTRVALSGCGGEGDSFLPFVSSSAVLRCTSRTSRPTLHVRCSAEQFRGTNKDWDGADTAAARHVSRASPQGGIAARPGTAEPNGGGQRAAWERRTHLYIHTHITSPRMLRLHRTQVRTPSRSAVSSPASRLRRSAVLRPSTRLRSSHAANADPPPTHLRVGAGAHEYSPYGAGSRAERRGWPLAAARWNRRRRYRRRCRRPACRPPCGATTDVTGRCRPSIRRTFVPCSVWTEHTHLYEVIFVIGDGAKHR